MRETFKPYLFLNFSAGGRPGQGSSPCPPVRHQPLQRGCPQARVMTQLVDLKMECLVAKTPQAKECQVKINKLKHHLFFCIYPHVFYFKKKPIHKSWVGTHKGSILHEFLPVLFFTLGLKIERDYGIFCYCITPVCDITSKFKKQC